MSGGAGTVTLERPASVTVGGVTVNSNMTPEQRSAAIRQSMGVAPAERGKPEGFAYNGPPIAYKNQAATMAPGRPSSPAPTPTQPPREDGTAGDAPHAGMIAPTPEELERINTFDQEMRDRGIQLPLVPEDGRFQRDERTGHIVDTAALEQCHKLWREMKPEERTSEARQEYHDTLEQIYAGQLQLADMEGTNAPRVEQPSDAQGRFAPSQYTPEQWAQGHASVTDEAGYIPIERVNTAGLSGYSLPKLVDGQTYHSSIFADLAWARANGISQRQVESFIADGMRKQDLIR